MKQAVSTLQVAFAMLAISGASAHAGPCRAEVARLERLSHRANAAIGPTETQYVGAQLHHQPTPASVKEAQSKAKTKVADVLSQAKALDAAGKEAECMAAVGDAKLLLGIE